MAGEKPCCAEAAARSVKKLTLAGGSDVGIANLENVLKEVGEMKLAGDDAVKRELLKRVKVYNYIAPSADGEYSDALLGEYRKLLRRQV